MTCLENRRRVASRILEDESLTADLADDAAKVLLDWGLARAEAIAQQVEGAELSQEELDAQIADLRRTMKRIGRKAGEASLETQVERVQALLAEIEVGRGCFQSEMNHPGLYKSSKLL